MRELPDEASAVASFSSVLCVVCHDYPLAVSFPGVSEPSIGTLGTKHFGNRYALYAQP